MIAYHHDIWSNFMADPTEITMLWNMKKDRLKYGFKPYIWQVGGKFVYPDNKDDMEYHYDRGFDDVFTKETDLPVSVVPVAAGTGPVATRRPDSCNTERPRWPPAESANETSR